jgi:hypothetical protein
MFNSLIVFLLLNFICVPLFGEGRETYSIQAVTAGMANIHLGMSKEEVDSVVGPPFWDDAVLAGIDGHDVCSWQIDLSDDERIKDNQVGLKLLVVGYDRGKVIHIQTVIITGMLGVGGK